MEKQRITYLDMVKGIGIILVVVGHSTYASDNLLKWITSFHMPLFFIVSGMLIYHTQEEKVSGKNVRKKKAKSIMIPYLTFSVISILISLIYYFYDPIVMPLDNIFLIVLKTITLNGNSVLWFLPALFFSEILFIEIRRRTNHITTIGVVIGIGVLGWLGKVFLLPYFGDLLGFRVSLLTVIFRIAMPTVLLLIGYYMMGIMNQYQKSKQSEKKKLIQEIVVGILLLVLNICISRYNGIVDLNFMIFNNPILYLLGAVSGTVAIILLCKNIKFNKFEIGLCYFGKNSLVIMATHLEFYILLIAIKISEWFSQLYMTREKDYVLYLSLALLIISMEIIVIYVYNHWLPFLLGKSKSKS